ncbi:uncharacterized protein LOC120291888 [Eucalyptus grandis]|uniref:uncharacterized protein LOC120291888 n=1 Tax=Eucalyptus grandis TaxID=71139 RepID=UPI00192E965A|nr:uncharacterized protein LOC120291888 [Eucalyptus grandis]
MFDDGVRHSVTGGGRLKSKIRRSASGAKSSDWWRAAKVRSSTLESNDRQPMSNIRSSTSTSDIRSLATRGQQRVASGPSPATGGGRPTFGGRWHESQLVKEVLRRVRQVLKKDDQVVTDKLVGTDLHVQEVMRKLGVVYNDGRAIEVCGQDLRAVGICGMPGVRKTALAKVIFNKMHMLFDEYSFL